MDGSWTRTGSDTQADDTPVWLYRLTVAVLLLVLIYVIVGIPEMSRSAEQDLQTDAVDPLHRFAWIVLFAAALPVAAVRWRQALRLLAASWPLLLLYAYFGLSIIWALDPPVAFRRWLLTLLQLLVIAVLMSGLRRAATLHVLIATACTIGAVADLVTWGVAPGYAMAPDGFAGLQLQKNLTGLLMMYGCLSAGTAFFLVRGRWPRVCIAGAVVLMAGLLVASRSTTSQSVVLLTPAVVAVSLLFVRIGKAGAWAIVTSILALLMAGVFGYLAWCGYTGADAWAPFAGMTFTSRTDIWSFVVEEIGKRPWLGAGYSSFWAIDPAVQPSLKSDEWFGTYTIINEAHDGYLDLLAMNGIVGLVAGLAVVFRIIGLAGRAVAQAEPTEIAWQTGRMAQPTALFHMALLIGLLVHNFTESNLFSNNSTLVVAFVFTSLDLEKWRLATARPAGARYPNPAGQRRPRSRVAATGAASPSP